MKHYTALILLVGYFCCSQLAQAGLFSKKRQLSPSAQLDNRFDGHSPGESVAVDIEQAINWLKCNGNDKSLTVGSSSVNRILLKLGDVISLGSDNLLSCRYSGKKLQNVRALAKELNPERPLYKIIIKKMMEHLERCSNEYNQYLMPANVEKNLDKYVLGITDSTDVCKNADRSVPVWRYKCMLGVALDGEKFAPIILEVIKSGEGEESFSKQMSKVSGSIMHKEIISSLVSKHLKLPCKSFEKSQNGIREELLDIIEWVAYVNKRRPVGFPEVNLIKFQTIYEQCKRLRANNSAFSYVYSLWKNE